MTKQKLNRKKQKKTKKQLLQRVRKEGRYSPLTTITMWLLKEMNKDLYQIEKKIAHEESITTQKNYYCSVLRMSMVYSYLVERMAMTPESATEKIFGYIQDHLVNVIRSKYEKTNPKLFLQMVYDKNLHDIRILRKVFKTQSRDLKIVQTLLFGLYEQVSIQQHRYQLNKIAKIIIKYGSGDKSNQKQKMLEQKQFKYCQLEEQNKEEVLGCRLKQCLNCKKQDEYQLEQLPIGQVSDRNKNPQIMQMQQNKADIKEQKIQDDLFSDLFFF